MNGSALDSITAASKKKPGSKMGGANMPPMKMGGPPPKQAKVPAPAVDPEEAAEALGDMGQHGDTEIAHVTPGEVILPTDMPADVMAMVEKALGDMGYSLAERTVAAEGAGPEHPASGAEEFYDAGAGDAGGADASDGPNAGSPAGDGGGVMGGGDMGSETDGSPAGDGSGVMGGGAFGAGGVGPGPDQDSGGFGGFMSGIAKGISGIVDKPGFDPRSMSPAMAGLSGLAEAIGGITGRATEALGGVASTDGTVGEGPSGGGGSQEPSIAPADPPDSNTPVDQGTTQQAPRTGGFDDSAARRALADYLRSIGGSGGALDGFLATPNTNPATGQQMFASGMDWRDPSTGVTYGFTNEAERNDWLANSDAGQRAQEGSAPAGQTVDEFKQSAGQAWNSPGGGGYGLAREQGHNDPTSDPRNPQPFAATAAADDPSPSPTQTGVSANAIEAFSALTPRRTPRFGTARNRPAMNSATSTQMFATRDNFDAEAYLADNADVAADAGYKADPWAHYQKYGQQEGRAANAQEKAARGRGFTGVFKGGRTDLTGESYTDWASGRANAAGFINPDSGGYRAELTSPRDSAALGPSMTDMAARSDARDRGYKGDFGAGGYNRYVAAYYDDDNDPATPMVGKPGANIDRTGRDASRARNVIRGAGWTGPWGQDGNSAGDWIQEQLRGLGYAPTGDIEQDALRASQATGRQFDPMSYVPTWMRGGGGLGKTPGTTFTMPGGPGWGAPRVDRQDDAMPTQPIRKPPPTGPQQPIRTPLSAWGGAPGTDWAQTRDRIYGPAFGGI